MLSAHRWAGVAAPAAGEVCGEGEPVPCAACGWAGYGCAGALPVELGGGITAEPP